MSELAKVEKNLPALATEHEHFTYEVDASDILIPRLLSAQMMSEAVAQEKVKAGDIYKSGSLEVVGGKGKPVEIILLHYTKTWVISKKGPTDSQYTFVTTEPHTPENRDKEWEWEEGGFAWKRTSSNNFFVLIKSEIEREANARKVFEETGEFPDVTDSLLPCLISFKSTSFKESKALVTYLAMAQDMKAPVYSNSHTVDTELKTDAKGKYFVFKVGKGSKTDAALRPVCEKWAKIVRGSSVRVADEADETQAEDGGAGYTGLPQF